MDPVFPLLFSMAALSIFITVLFALAWWNMQKESYLLIWSIAFAMASIQWILNIVRDDFSSHASYWTLVTFFSIAVVVLAHWGHALRAGKADKRTLQAICCVSIGVYIAICWVSFNQSSQAIKFGLQPAYCGLLIIWCAPPHFAKTPKAFSCRVDCSSDHRTLWHQSNYRWQHRGPTEYRQSGACLANL